MNLTLKRERFSDHSTRGVLFLDDVFYCYTLEPRKDQSLGKPYCIPAGKYEVVLQYSPRFDMVTPHILGVPRFEGIEIHPGNYPSNTEGCILLGMSWQDGVLDPETGITDAAVWSSKPAFNGLMRHLSTLADLTIL